jgi:SAM-dependent methyltransferase
LIREALKKVPLLQPAVRYLRRQAQVRARRIAWAHYAATQPVRKLDIGPNARVLPGWFGVDIEGPFQAGKYFMDATEPFPFPAEAFDFIRSEHMIEHIWHADGLRMLRECHRVLRPGGFIRIATPDLRILAGLYDEPLSDGQRAYISAVLKRFRKDYDGSEVGVAINQNFALGHAFIYDRDTLSEWLRRAGFANVVQVSPGVSDHEAFRGADAHAAEDDFVTFETLTMEARKGGATH